MSVPVRQAPVICVMAPPIHLGARSMAGCILSYYLLVCVCVCVCVRVCVFGAGVYVCTWVLPSLRDMFRGHLQFLGQSPGEWGEGGGGEREGG